MSPKLKVGIIFGGRSVEHEVSILTGYQALAAVRREKYDVVPVYLARDNVWYIGDELEQLDFFRQDHPPLNRLTRVLPAPDAAKGKLILLPLTSGLFKRPVAVEIDVVIPTTHGTFVEDGCLQGVLEMANVPYAGSKVRGSAVGMDKLLTKAVLMANGLPLLPYQPLKRNDFEADPDAAVDLLERRIGYPMMVKPAVLGSSVGVSRVKDRTQLSKAVDLALHFGMNVLVEPALVNYKEINCAVMDGDPPIPSVLEQPISGQTLLTFDEKYRGKGKGGSAKGSKGMAGQQRIIPAPLPAVQTERIRQLAVSAFEAVGAGGVARVDFLITEGYEIFVNELNNIPGSLSFYLWEFMGKSFSDLLDRMIEQALYRHKEHNRTTYTFEANLLAGN